MMEKKHSRERLLTVKKLCEERGLPLYKISNMIRVSPYEFSEWLKQFHQNQRIAP